jgi:hypothetical protein
MEDLLKTIPEKSKRIWERLKEDWKIMSIPEKAGVVALAIITSPAIAIVAADILGRHEKRIKEVI